MLTLVHKSGTTVLSPNAALKTHFWGCVGNTRPACRAQEYGDFSHLPRANQDHFAPREGAEKIGREHGDPRQAW